MQEPRIRSEAFLRQDIQAVLQAIIATHNNLARRLPQAEVAIYRAGFMAAMQAVAAAFHIEVEIGAPDECGCLQLPEPPELRIIGELREESID